MVEKYTFEHIEYPAKQKLFLQVLVGVSDDNILIIII